MRFLGYLSFCLILSASNSVAEGNESPLVVADPVVVRGLEWLKERRQSDYGFKEDTVDAVVAFQLANATSSWYAPENLESLLTVKQMDIEILLRLFRRHESPAGPNEISMFGIALSTLCRDPRQFYGHDLIGSLSHQEMLLDLEIAFSSLAICTSGTHVRKRQIRRLADVTQSNKSLNIETLSMAIIALDCIVQDHRNRKLHHYLLNPTKKLATFQKADGSFGSLKETASAIQALQSTDPGGRHWNKTSAINYLKRLQNENGSFGDEQDVPTTVSVLLALGPRGLPNIKDLNCHPDRPNDWSNGGLVDVAMPLNFTFSDDDDNNGHNNQINAGKATTAAASSAATEAKISSGIDWTKPTGSVGGGSATVTYSLWVGSNVTETHTINVTTDVNDTFYNVMQLAAEKDDHFLFSSTEWPNGHYVHTLAGHKEEPMSYHYWLLYKLPTMPVVGSPPPNRFVAPVGVDELLVRHGDHYLFWYKKL